MARQVRPRLAKLDCVDLPLRHAELLGHLDGRDLRRPEPANLADLIVRQLGAHVRFALLGAEAPLLLNVSDVGLPGHDFKVLDPIVVPHSVDVVDLEAGLELRLREDRQAGGLHREFVFRDVSVGLALFCTDEPLPASSSQACSTLTRPKT